MNAVFDYLYDSQGCFECGADGGSIIAERLSDLYTAFPPGYMYFQAEDVATCTLIW